MWNVWVLAALVAAFSACSRPPAPRPAATPSAIVLFIADGTSSELLTAARYFKGGAEARLGLEDFPHSALVRTFSASDLVTDSGAAATAMARGIKADNKVVGLASPESTTSPPSLLDLAKSAGWSTGVVTDDSVTGGTPAPFLVEHFSRDEQAAIAGKIIPRLGPRADIVLGGGSKWFVDSVSDPAVIYRAGERPVVAANQRALEGGTVLKFDKWEAFKAHVGNGGDGHAVLGVFEPDVFSFFADGRRTLRLKDLVAEAVTFLQARGRPFLLIAEGGLPDKACHLNNARRALIEVLEFDEAVSWTRDHLGPNALILATTDHATGGLTFSGPVGSVSLHGDAILENHPLTAVPILGWTSGPGGERETANVRTRIVPTPGEPLQQVTETIPPTDPEFVQPAAVPVRSAMHTAGDVWLLASGPGSENIHGFLDNTDIYRIIAHSIPPSP